MPTVAALKWVVTLVFVVLVGVLSVLLVLSD